MRGWTDRRDVPGAKAALRRDVLRRRRTSTVDQRDQSSLAVGERALALPEVRAARVMATYAATIDEVDPLPIVRSRRATGVLVCYPKVAAPPRRLTFWPVWDERRLRPGTFGLLEPETEGRDPVDADRIDLALVPLVAFDEACHRLGMGAGFYDRFLAAHPGIRRIGLAFEVQRVTAVPVEAHDQVLDVVVTERAVYRPARPRPETGGRPRA